MEDETQMKPNPSPSLPCALQHINLWNNYEEKYHQKNKTQFQIKEYPTSLIIWVALRRLNYWEFRDPQDPKLEEELREVTLIAQEASP